MSVIKIDDVVLVDIHKLIPNPDNTNEHPQDQIDHLAEQYAYTGMRTPIIVSKQSGLIVAGHGRWLAAKKAKLKQVPVSYQDFETPEQEFAFSVADNATPKWATLNLSKINLQLPRYGPELKIKMLGIKDFELEPADKYADKDADEVPKEVEPICKLGQIWKLGEHRLMCGDSTDEQQVGLLMDGQKADMVFTDPPYGVSYTGGHNKKKRTGIENDELKGSDLSDLFYLSISRACEFSNEHTAFYIWYANGKAVETFNAFSRIPLKVRAVLCWYKVKSGLGAFMSQYIPNYEPCIYAHKENQSPQWFGPTDEKTVWELKKESKNEFHPTQKPVELPERAIKNSSKIGQNVIDLFGGSGSTLIACEKTNRKCYMMELDPHYCDVIIARWEKFTGKKAELAN